MQHARASKIARSRPPFVLLLLPALLLLFVVGGRATRFHRPEDREANEAAHTLLAPELSRLRQQADHENSRAASQSAHEFVQTDLLSSVAPEDIEQITVTRLRPHRYRVRGIVHWSTNGPQTRRFETDLQLGPTDAKWRLVDTEFLP